MVTTERSGRPAVEPGSGVTPELEARIATLRDRVEESLEELLDRELSGLPSPAREPVRYAVLSPGKRIRPLLLLAAYRAAGGRSREAATLACSVELVHAYSLIHDDLPCMDDDVLRRGRPTLHVEYGVPTAVFTGASLMPLAVRTVRRAGAAMGLEADRVRRLVGELAVASGARGMVGGQLGDLRAEGRDVTPAELESIHRRKTAALMAAAVRMGGMAGRAEPALVDRLGSFGEKLGLAFQAVDDILDVTGTAGELGKSSGRDAALGKATYPSVLGLEEAEAVSRRLAGAALDELAEIPESGLLRDITSYVIRRRR